MKWIVTLWAALIGVAVMGQSTVRRAPNLATLQSQPPSAVNPTVFVEGLNGGFFTWNASSVVATNAVDRIAYPYGSATGRYLRQVAMGGVLDFDSTADLTFLDLKDFSLDGQTVFLQGVQRLDLVSADLYLSANTNLSILTPQMNTWDPSSVLLTNRLMTLVDPTNGYWEAVSLDELRGGSGIEASKLTKWSAAKQLVSTDVDIAEVSTVVDNVPALVALDPTDRELVQTLGYHAPGDGGGGVYRWTNSLPSGVVTNLGTWFAGSSGYWNLQREGDVYNVKQFGAKGSSLADGDSVYFNAGDDSVAIQNAIDICTVNGGGHVYMPSGMYYLASALLIQRREDVLTRTGWTDPDPSGAAYWAKYSRVKLTGDYIATTLVTDTDINTVQVFGKPTYSGYNNRVENVMLEDFNCHQMTTTTNTVHFNLFNVGQIGMRNLRTRRGFIGVKVSAASEVQINKCDFLAGTFGAWLERGPGSEAGDMAGVTFLDCNFFSQQKACFVAHYFRDIHVIGGFMGTREYADTVATVWLSNLSPDANDSIWFQDVGMEGNPEYDFPVILVGSDGTEGVYSLGVYPFNTYTNSAVDMNKVSIQSCGISFASRDGVVRVRGDKRIVEGVVIENTRFDKAATANVITIEPEVPDTVVIQLGNGNAPDNLLARIRDERPAFNLNTIERNAGNLINGGWRDMSKGGQSWFGPNAVRSVVTNIVGPFGIEVEAGSTKTAWNFLFSGGSPLVVNSNSVLTLDYAVHWPSTNTAQIQNAVRLIDENSNPYQLSSLGIINEYARYTNAWGVWHRYVASVRPPVGAPINRVGLYNWTDTNAPLTIGYLAIYSDTYSGDMTSVAPGTASIWSGKFNSGDLQWVQTPSAGNWHSRKWTAGWAVREAFNSASTYTKGTAISSSTNIYLATTSISSGGSAPTHTSGITDGWAFVATGSAATEERVVTRTASSVSLPATTVTSLAGDSPTTSTLSESGGNVTITGGGKRTYSHYLNAATGGDANLVFASTVDGDTGTLLVWAASTNVTLTLTDAFAYSPSGSTLTVTGGTNNWSVVAWEARTIDSTNVVLVNLGDYSR